MKLAFDEASLRLALVASTLAMFLAALMFSQLGWTFWEQQVPIWLVGVMAGYLTLWRCGTIARDDA